MESFWENVAGDSLRQGDFLPDCPVASFDSTENEVNEISVREYDLIIMTQSCDLENRKAQFVALCPTFPISVFEEVNPRFQRKNEWENVRKGRVEGLHLLASPDHPSRNRDALVVDFREIYSLPFNFLAQHAAHHPVRWRLKSPYLEHFSQAFARFFMRVGLPSAIPPFK